MVKLLINGDEVKFETTIFPDGTSQVWKIDENGLAEYDQYSGDPEILWLFENEGELMHVLQLTQLLDEMTNCETVTLKVPYLPYGRQDKDVNNKASFALKTFAKTLYNANICRVETYDAHSLVQTDTYIESTTASEFHQSILNHDVVCYPDKGAATRYGSYGLPVVYCEKIRDQLTGNILGLKVSGDADLTNKRVLIIDDICDGGMTFIKVAEALKPFNPKQVDLAVSHGLFSKGKQCLHDAGITNIFTTNSLLRNPEGYKVW